MRGKAIQEESIREGGRRKERRGEESAKSQGRGERVKSRRDRVRVARSDRFSSGIDKSGKCGNLHDSGGVRRRLLGPIAEWGFHSRGVDATGSIRIIPCMTNVKAVAMRTCLLNGSKEHIEHEFR